MTFAATAIRWISTDVDSTTTASSPLLSDQAALYAFLLGREPEFVLSDDQRVAATVLMRDLLTSLEFSLNVSDPISNRRPIAGGFFDRPPAPALKAWLAQFAPMSEESRRAILAARSWYALFHAVFSDGQIRAEVLRPDDLIAGEAFAEALMALDAQEALHRIEGQVEEIGPSVVRGWVVDPLDLKRRLVVELFIDGVLVNAAGADAVRRDLQDRFGPEATGGFVLKPPADRLATDRPQRAVVREAASGIALASFVLPPAQPVVPDETVGLRAELAQVRTALDRIEARLPGLGAAYAYSLDTYPAYFETYYGRGEALIFREPTPRDEMDAQPRISVLIDAVGVEPVQLADALDAALAQSWAPDEVILLGEPTQSDLLDDLARRAKDLGRAPVVVRLCDAGSGRGAAGVLAATGDLLVLATAAGVLARDALYRCALAWQDPARRPDVIFWDDDRLDPGPLERAGHAAPRFKTAFDPDLLMQQDYLGPALAIRATAAKAAIGRLQDPDAKGSGFPLELALLVLADPNATAEHIPRVLFHARSEPGLHEADPAAFERIVRGHLARTRPGAVVQRRGERLHVISEIKLEGRKATVVVPTRNRLDLLQPCIDSLIASQDSNVVRLDILVVDNGSDEPDLARYLAARAGDGVRVLPFPGPFNWALINNRAVADSDADVFIFLNNDTVALSPDWADALCAQALRPDVAAVGARLLYPDGTVQHAGVVLGGVDAFAAHEGVGDAGDDPGYMGRHVHLRRTCVVSGACLAASSAAFRALGGFDSARFPIEGNETDYCIRALDVGMIVLYEPAAELIHFESKTRGTNQDEDRWRASLEVFDRLKARWPKAGEDPFYNPHFDRAARPLARLRSPVDPKIVRPPPTPAAPPPEPPAPEPAPAGLLARLSRRLRL